MNRELKASCRKSLAMVKGVVSVISLVLAVYFITVLNKIIDTASFRMPSPKTILKSLGYCS